MHKHGSRAAGTRTASSGGLRPQALGWGLALTAAAGIGAYVWLAAGTPRAPAAAKGIPAIGSPGGPPVEAAGGPSAAPGQAPVSPALRNPFEPGVPGTADGTASAQPPLSVPTATPPIAPPQPGVAAGGLRAQQAQGPVSVPAHELKIPGMAVRPATPGGMVIAPPSGAAATAMPVGSNGQGVSSAAVAQMNAAVRAAGQTPQAVPIPVPVQDPGIQVKPAGR